MVQLAPKVQQVPTAILYNLIYKIIYLFYRVFMFVVGGCDKWHLEQGHR